MLRTYPKEITELEHRRPIIELFIIMNTCNEIDNSGRQHGYHAAMKMINVSLLA